MQLSDVEKIFEEKKSNLTKNCFSLSNPVAILLGGQPACGKTRLTERAEQNHQGINFLIVNGDNYRQYHPEHDLLLNNIVNYSENTQIFSNTFTGRMIDEAIKNRYSIIVEGTMRNPDVPMTTAAKFRKAGFKTEAYVIAAPSFFTRVGVYNRYLNELKAKGYGRLADMRSHDAAVDGLVKSVNVLYLNQSVDNISIYTFLAKERVKEFILHNGHWNSAVLPGDVIAQTRIGQLSNKEDLAKTGAVLTSVRKMLSGISPRICNQISPEIQKLSEQYAGIMEKKGNTRENDSHHSRSY
jgi:hypothetical protein